MTLPTNLISEIRNGRLVLFLGAGGSVGATDPEDKGPPLGSELRDLLADKFLGGDFKDRSLPVAAELAQSESDLIDVQQFIADQYRDLRPAPFHLKIPSLKWRAIATTNFDLVIERAYSESPDPLQELVPIYSNEDRVDEKLRSEGQVAFLKLHGCVTITQREDLPLILTIDQYSTHKRNRKYVFDRFEGLAREYPVLFIGHRLEDSNIREMLRRLTQSPQTRPRYYLVDPIGSEIEARFWEQRKVTSLHLTLEEFLEAVEAELPRGSRTLLKHVKLGHAIERRLAVREELSPTIRSLLEEQVEYVHDGMPYEEGTPGAFYRGFDLGWYPVLSGLDVRRRLTDTLLFDVIIRPEDDRPRPVELYAVKAEAGAGKSVLLRRLAWEAATEADVLTLYVRNYGVPDSEDLAELYRITQQRIFLIWDNAADHVSELMQLLSQSQHRQLPLTIISAERVNEWNMSCDRLEEFLTDEFKLRYLSEREIWKLVELLETHDSLGPNLRYRSMEDRVEQFKVQAGRMLLVALHEATMGIPFEDILQDEYEELRPIGARQLYLTVCVLNRLRIPVRAGLISRIHGISFESFKQDLFQPLDHVVEVEERPTTGDYFYRARHPEIAQIVFTRILSSREDRFNEFIRILGGLNLSYSTDLEAFRGLLRAKSLDELFPDYQDVRAIYEKAEEVGELEAYLYQQMANYERIRNDGNLNEAEGFLKKARELSPQDHTITHTLAEIYRAQAERQATWLARQRLRDEARTLARSLLDSQTSDNYARVTLVKIGMDEIRDMENRQDLRDREIDETIRQVERLLEAGLQKYPDDQYLLTAEADFSSLVADSQRAFSALKRAFEANPRDPYLASRLARSYLSKDHQDDALETLKEALNANRGDLRLNYQYAEVLRKLGRGEPEMLAYHYERAFTEGDKNYEAQFWFARFAFESDDPRRKRKSKNTFDRLRQTGMAHRRRVQVRDQIQGNGRVTIFQGSIEKVGDSYGYVRRDGPSDVIFAHSDNTSSEEWANLRKGDRVRFSIGFSYTGPKALDLKSVR